MVSNLANLVSKSYSLLLFLYYPMKFLNGTNSTVVDNLS
jgi:hypothetical protein